MSRLQAGDAGEVGVAEVVEEVAAEARAGRAASRVPPPPARARCILRHKIMAQGLLISSPLQFKSSQNCRLLIQVAVKYFKLTKDNSNLKVSPRLLISATPVPMLTPDSCPSLWPRDSPTCPSSLPARPSSSTRTPGSHPASPARRGSLTPGSCSTTRYRGDHQPTSFLPRQG